jgi:hypothetical protein
MALDEAYKCFSIASSVAVIISLAVVVVQLRKATIAAKSNVYQNIIASLANINAALAQGKDSVKVYIKGRDEVDKVEQGEIEKVIFGFFMSSAFNLYENLYYQHDRGLLDQELWGAWDKAISRYIEFPGVRHWWERNEDKFHESFRKYVNEHTKKFPEKQYRHEDICISSEA